MGAFDNNYSNAGSLEFLDPVAKAITKWLNGENVEPFMAGIDPNWDIQFKSIPRVIAGQIKVPQKKKAKIRLVEQARNCAPDNSFMDKSLPVNTGVNARMVVIDKQGVQ